MAETVANGVANVDVLVVDDDELTREALCTLLAERGYTAFDAPDGRSALTRLRTHPRPLVVLLDWLLPGMDGIAVIRALAASAPLPHRHAIILLTAAVITERHQLPLSTLPLDHYVMLVRKPFDIDQLLAQVAAAASLLTGKRS